MSESRLSKYQEKTVLNLLVDFLVTMICWGYFIFAFLFFFSFFYLFSYLFSADKERSFQNLNYRFFGGFLALLRALSPSHKWTIDPSIANIRGSIIVCNHLSYLDPLLFLSLFQKNKTIVKTTFFSAPVFGWIITVSGYLPATTEGIQAGRMIDQLEKMGDFFEDGGNLFVFPEGTRNRKTSIDALHKGVFKIARMHRRPIQVLCLNGTENLFTPGRFFFNTRLQNQINLQMVDTIAIDQGKERISISTLEKKVRNAFMSPLI